MTVHGGTDAGPPVTWDFSTNANCLGPSPPATSAVLAADPGPYPDPTYRRTREALAALHHTHPDRVAVGAGASELVLRLVRAVPGPVATLSSTFAEYARCARIENRRLLVADTLSELAEVARDAGLVFVCSPNTPDGRGARWEELRAVAQATPRAVKVLDLAYLPLAQGELPTPDGWVHLHAPNKAHGMTDIRAAYLLAPEGLSSQLADIAPAWVVSTPGVAFLEAITSPEARSWVEGTLPELHRLRDLLARRLRERRLEVEVGAANFLMVRGIAGLAPVLRSAGIKVRECASFGLPGWVRLSAQPEPGVDALIEVLEGGG